MIYSAEGINWTAVIAHHRPLLARVVEMLFSMVIGLDEGRMVTTLPRCTRNHIYRILRPAESALRRLIMIAARDVKLDDAIKNSVVLGLEPRTHSVNSAKAATLKKGRCSSSIEVNLGLAGMGPRLKAEDDAGSSTSRQVSTRPPAFPLIDPLKHFHFGPRRRYSKSVPRITWLDGRDRKPLPAINLPEPGDPVDATRLCRRLVALRNALENLDREAHRLARWKARRHAGRVRRLSPMRPGYPPGRRKRRSHEVDEILKDLHSWALYSEETNTS